MITGMDLRVIQGISVTTDMYSNPFFALHKTTKCEDKSILAAIANEKKMIRQVTQRRVTPFPTPISKAFLLRFVKTQGWEASGQMCYITST